MIWVPTVPALGFGCADLPGLSGTSLLSLYLALDVVQPRGQG